MCFLVWASWEGDGFDSLEAVGQIPLWCALVETGTEGVEVNWGILVFPCSNWELNVTLQLWIPQRRGRDGANIPVPQRDGPGTLLPSGSGAGLSCPGQVLPVPSSLHQQTPFPLVFPRQCLV